MAIRDAGRSVRNPERVVYVAAQPDVSNPFRVRIKQDPLTQGGASLRDVAPEARKPTYPGLWYQTLSRFPIQVRAKR